MIAAIAGFMSSYYNYQAEKERYYYYFIHLKVFHTNGSWWSFTGVWVTANPHEEQLVSPSPTRSIVFFNSLARSRYLYLFLHSFRLTLRSTGKGKFTIAQVLFYCLFVIAWSGRLAEIRWPVCTSKSHFVHLIFQDGLCFFFTYHLFALSLFNFKHIFQWITLPTQFLLVLNSLSANLLPCLGWAWLFPFYHHIIHIYHVFVSCLFLFWLS